MAPLNFNASLHEESNKIRLTFGRTRSEVRWSDRREYTFQELGALLASVSIGGKDGPCYTPAVFRGSNRRLEHAEQIDVAVLDSDAGHNFGEICELVKAKGWRAIVHSTFSHMSDTSQISAEAAEKWLAANPGATIGAYMAHKQGYLARVIEGAAIVDDVSIGNKRNFVIKHAPCPKFRVLIPLAEPWIADNFESQDIANQSWRERIAALASALGLSHDQSCVDTSRLFYLPRISAQGRPFDHAVIDGESCDLYSLPDAARPADGVGVVTQPMGGLFGRPQEVRADHKSFVSEHGEFFDLTAWAAKYALRFEVVAALQARAPGIFTSRVNGAKRHIICPNAGDHVTTGHDETGTYAVSASQVGFAGLPSVRSGFVIKCMHNGCADHDRLDHIKALLGAGKLAISDLTAPAFLMPEKNEADFTGIISKATLPPRVGKALAPPPEEVGNIAPSLYANLPGALGALHEWMLATSPKPQPVLALGAALAFAASVIGQRVKIQRWDIRPNIYVLGIAYSGAGKDRPMSACKQVARAAGLFSDLIGVEEITSDAGIVTSVAKAPRQLMLIDEVSFILRAAGQTNAGPHLAGVVSTLLKLYSHSDQTYKSKSYADSDKVKIIQQPCVSFYGSCVPSGLTEALSSKDINSGLLSRMMLFDAGECDPMIRTPQALPVPADVVDWVSAWNRVQPVQNVMNMIGGEQVMEPRTVLVTDDAYDIAQAFIEEMHHAKIKARKRGKDALYVRAFENAAKFALIRACAEWPQSSDMGPAIDETALRVDAATMQWAVDLSRATVQRMDAATDEIADSGFEQNMGGIKKVVRRAGERGLTERELSRTSAGKHPKRTLDDLLERLTVAGDVFWIKIKTGGRAREAYVHKDFLHIHNADTAKAIKDEDDDE